MVLALAPLSRTALAPPRAAVVLQDPSSKALDSTPPVFSVVEDTVPVPDPPNFSPNAYVQTLPGISGPLGFFDPAGFCGDNNGADGSATLGKVKFYREVELKHGRVAMLASLGFLVGENFHPLFGGNIDVPSYVAFQQTPLQVFWPAVVFVIASLEVFSVFTFEDPNVEGWAIRADHEPGTLGSNNRRWDPLGLAPSDPAEFKAMQTKELNNGRLAMIAIAGMIAQELVTKTKLF
ncbi:light harvesting protein [Emiliania huxleyi CCMP1516]|uniref:Light harvesting protein n=2 Tax=Emiliania huxleyi TaxID=2903 RepID=A0A0D3KJE3_EMIH1|nr:light harvesting protein [Emiliania huxleyi CCMP1516]EOD35878.1 light harvesting protein [Emiliania huxleyi CCMP1516]|eukprot:XP_005788307.1 light harvesting protein [Emiliania huxleyi CCMP1516]